MITLQHTQSFNLDAAMKYLADPIHRDAINADFASLVVDKDDWLLMAFENVEDHRDGNGMTTVVMLHGSGTFYLDDQPIKLNVGDVIHFSDHIEHGFVANQLCFAVLINWEKENPTQDEIIARINSVIPEVNSTIS